MRTLAGAVMDCSYWGVCLDRGLAVKIGLSLRAFTAFTLCVCVRVNMKWVNTIYLMFFVQIAGKGNGSRGTALINPFLTSRWVTQQSCDDLRS